MADEFEAAVEDGLRLSKRIYFGKDRAVTPPKMPTLMERAAGCSYLPASPMVYAVISDPSIVDNPDMPSYQPHVHGRCDPPALIPLQMNGVSLEVDSYLDTAFVTLTASWRVHCVMGNRSCDCRIAVPMGEQGSILGVEVELPRKSYRTQLAVMNDESRAEKVGKIGDGGFLRSNIFTLKVPQIDGGTNLSVKIRWSQQLLYIEGQFTLNIPFSFPEYVTPVGKKTSKREKIQLNINSGLGTEVLCKTTSHPLKERLRQAGKLGFLYDSEVLKWSSNDFVFTFGISSSYTSGGVLLSPPSLHDTDRRETFCCFILPGMQKSENVFRRNVVFLVDISGSMKGKLLEDTKNALFGAITMLNPGDLFNVIAFNNETYLFSSSLEPATAAVIENVTQWINVNFVAGGGTNFLLPINTAIDMLANSQKSMPIIFLITDGAVADERHICGDLKSQLTNQKNFSPRIYTLGIGAFCNHYFLRMLATIGRGHHDAAIDLDSIEVRMKGLFAIASSVSVAKVSFENLDIDDLEVFPSQIPDLSYKRPLVVSGRYRGTFPVTLKVNGVLPDMSNFSLELKRLEAKEIPIDKIVAKKQIELLTTQAWFTESKELEDKVAKMSVQTAIVSEYTYMSVLETKKEKIGANSTSAQQVSSKAAHGKTEDSNPQKIAALHNTRYGFGDINATAENISPLFGDTKLPEAAEIFIKATSGCCGKLCRHCCCMCCIQTCSKMNDQCAIALTQLCGALACLGCYSCCAACCGGDH